MDAVPGTGRASPALARLAPLAAAARRLLDRILSIRPLYVVGVLVVVEWLITLGLVLTVRHNGWVYYQGGDQVWFYSTSWGLAHGQMVGGQVGYGLSVLLMPLVLVGGPNLLQMLPAIVLLNVVLLMPVAMAAMYGIGERLGGRLFGYWVLVVWIVTPLVGIRFTDAGFHQRYTEVSLPQTFGLTALADFPSMVVLAVGAYFLLRALDTSHWADAALAGSFVGFAIGIKPSSALFLGGATLAVIAALRPRATAIGATALAANLLALVVWKWRGYGYLPLFHGAGELHRLAAGAAGGVPLAGINLSRYLYFDWGHIQTNLDTIQEHFWSVRVFEWLVLAGLVALARISLRALLLFGGWFFAFALVKGSDPLGNIQDTSLLRMLIPAIPAFVVMLAALPLLLPGAARATRRRRPHEMWRWRSPRLATTAVAACGILFVAVPAGLALAAHRLPTSSSAFVNAQAGPIPTDRSLHLDTAVVGEGVRLSWQKVSVAAGRSFYWVVRGSDCSGTTSLSLCATTTTLTDAKPGMVDTPGSGTYLYVLEVSANWLNDPAGGDPYVASPPAAVTVP